MEKRRARRYEFRIKAQIHAEATEALSGPLEGWTRDVSAKGLFLELDQTLAVGTQMQLHLELPAEVTGKPVTLRCTSRVARVVKESGRQVGVGAFIESYEFIGIMEKQDKLQ